MLRLLLDLEPVGSCSTNSERIGQRRSESDTGYGSCSPRGRLVSLPAEVDLAKASAELKNGILTIALPKAAQAKARRVDLSVRV